MTHQIAFNQSNQQNSVAEKIARKGILNRVKFDQWHVFNALRSEIKNVNVLNLASLLAALARMDCTAYEIPQNEIAHKFGCHFDEKIPTRQAVARWEKQLADCGLIRIPKAPGRGQTATKRRYFTQKFINIACRKKPKKSSYTSIHATAGCAASTYIRVVQGTDNPQPDPNQLRAFKHNNKQVKPEPARITNKNQNPARPRPPKFKTANQKPLTKFQKSVQWWLWQNRNVSGPADATILFALFLQMEPGDDYLNQLRAAWKNCGDASRHGLINGLVEYLRQQRELIRRASGDRAGVLFSGNKATDTPENSKADTGGNLVSLDKRKFSAALCGFDDNYTGPARHIVDTFHQSSESEQQRILELFQAGAFDKYFRAN